MFCRCGEESSKSPIQVGELPRRKTTMIFLLYSMKKIARSFTRVEIYGGGVSLNPN